MRISDFKRTTAEYVADQTTCENTAGSQKKSGRLHWRNLAKTMAISLALLISTPFAAHAHTSLISSNPAFDSTVQQFPTEISLTFNETLMKLGGKQVSKFTVHKPNHDLVKLSALKVNGGVISAKVKESDLPVGTYKIYFRVISADGHPVSGFLKFNYKSESNGNEIEVLKPVDLSHFWHLHKWHTIEAIAAIGLIIAWALYRRRNRN